jgi:hypothetical protein
VSTLNLAPLFVVAVRELDGVPEERAAALARVLGLTLYEARGKITPPAPRVVASFADRGSAEDLVARLADEGFAPLLLPSDTCEGDAARVYVRSFERMSDGWTFEARDGWKRVVRDQDFRVLLHLRSTNTHTQTDTVTTRSFSMKKAVLTGGLAMRSKKTVETTSSSTSTEASVLLSAKGHPTFGFRESELQFQGLGADLQPARVANWRFFVEQLRSRTPSFDERLAKRAGQVQVLGGVLDPDRHIDMAIALVTRSLMGS